MVADVVEEDEIGFVFQKAIGLGKEWAELEDVFFNIVFFFDLGNIGKFHVVGVNAEWDIGEDEVEGFGWLFVHPAAGSRWCAVMVVGEDARTVEYLRGERDGC